MNKNEIILYFIESEILSRQDNDALLKHKRCGMMCYLYVRGVRALTRLTKHIFTERYPTQGLHNNGYITIT